MNVWSMSTGRRTFFFGDHTDGALQIFANEELLRYGYDGPGYTVPLEFPFENSLRDHWTYHCVLQRDGVTEAYVNADMLGSVEEDLASVDPANAAIARHWAYGGTRTTTRFTGSVDEVRIYDRALSEEEIAGLYNGDPTDYEFAEFSINYAMLWFRSREAGLKDWVLLRGSFVLGDDTDGIDPATEDVTATVGSHTLTIPAGSFFIGQQGNRYVYRGLDHNSGQDQVLR